MNVQEAFQKLWSKLQTPNSCCPDISLWDIKQAMAGVLSETLDPSLTPAENFILSHLQISPTSEENLTEYWGAPLDQYDLCPEPPNGDYEDPTYLKVVDENYANFDNLVKIRKAQISQGLYNLANLGFIGVDPVKPIKFFAILK